MSTLSGKELASLFTEFVNTNNNEKHQEFIDAFSAEHRTLQQSGLGLMLQLIEHMASDAYETDTRNEDSKKMAQDLIKGFKVVKKEEYLAEGYSETRAEEYLSTESGSKPSKYLPFI